jgi:hypothetical protein
MRQTLEVTANSLDDARSKAKEQTPKGFRIISEEIINDGKSKVIRKTKENFETAVEKAKSELPKGSKIGKIVEIQCAKNFSIQEKAETQEAIREIVKGKYKNAHITSIGVSAWGKKGVFGIGKTPNTYEIKLTQDSIAEITYSNDAKVNFIITDSKIASWTDLCATMKNEDTAQSGNELFSEFGYHILFALLTEKINDPSFFTEIPFEPITQEVVKKATEYVEHPEILTKWAMFLPETRYIIRKGHVSRASIYEVDKNILETSHWLSKRKTSVSREDFPAAVFGLIMRFQQMPLLYFFFSLPYLQGQLSNLAAGKKVLIIKEEAEITAYKGIDVLLLQMYDELGLNEFIKDENVKKKVMQMLNTK